MQINWGLAIALIIVIIAVLLIVSDFFGQLVRTGL